MVRRSKASEYGKEEDNLRTSFNVQLPTGTLLPVSLHQFEPLQSVYSSVATTTGVPVRRIRVKYTGKVLSQTSTVNSLGIMNDMVLKAESITEQDVCLAISLPDGSSVTLEEIKNTDKVARIFDKLIEAGDYSNVSLKANGKELHRETVIFDAKITSKTKITAHRTNAKKETSRRTEKSAGSGYDCGSKESSVNEVGSMESESQTETVPEFNADGKRVEVVFSFDTTGSMYSVLDKVRSKLTELMERLLQDVPDIRIGIIAHGDFCDHNQYVIKCHDLGVDVASLKEFAMNVPRTGGGDAPEAYELVLQHAQHMDWSEDSAKALVVIGDERPHPPSYTTSQIYWHTELDILSGMGVKIYGVQAQPYPNTTPFYKELAERTDGAYLKFSNFNLVQEMFLAVCYKEFSDQQLEDYMADLEEAGHLDEQKEQMFNQLKTKVTAVEESKAIGSDSVAFDPKQSRNYVADSWFDRNLDNGSPQYTFDLNKRKWRDYREAPSVVTHTPALVSVTAYHKPTRKQALKRLLCIGS